MKLAIFLWIDRFEQIILMFKIPFQRMMHRNYFAGGIRWTVEATRSEGLAWSDRNRQGHNEDKAEKRTKQENDRGTD